MTDNWRERAACKGVSTRTFFPETTTDARLYLRSVRETYCSNCPALIDCAREALDNGERHGIWGGVWVGQNKGGRARTELAAIAAGGPLPEMSNGGGNRPGHRRAS